MPNSAPSTTPPPQEFALLVVEDDRVTSDLICLVLEANDFRPIAAYTAAEAMATLKANPSIAAAVIDLSLPDGDGIDIMREAHHLFPALPCFVLTAKDAVGTIVVAMKAGATDYMVKPFDPEILLATLKSATEVYLAKLGKLQSSPNAGIGRTWNSPRMQLTVGAALKAAKTASPVMITGCHNTGKKAIAELIHQASGNHEPLITIDAALVSSPRLASDLFGSESLDARMLPIGQGKLDKNRGSNLYIENIEFLSADLQADLFKWLAKEESQDEGKTPRCRLITSTSLDPSTALKTTNFRQDLWYALRVYHVETPRLAERQEDIPQLCEDMLTSICITKKLRRPTLTRKVAEILQDHTWPGNLSELQSVLEHAVTHTRDGLIGPADLPPLKVSQKPIISSESQEVFLGLASIKDITKAHLIATLDACEGNRRRAAQRLNISLRTVYNMIQRYKITTPKRKRTRARSTPKKKTK